MPWTMGVGKDLVFVDSNLVVQARHPNKNSGAMKMPPVTVPLSPLWPHAFGRFKVTAGSDVITNSTDLNQDIKDYWKGALYLGFHKWSWCLQYLWTAKSSNPAGNVVEAKKRQLAFDLHDRNYIIVKNISVFAASVNMYNANNCIIGGCRLSYISHFQKWEDSREGLIDHIANPDESSALFKGEAGIIVGGTDNTFLNCIIEYSSGAGLYLNGNRTTVENCIIHDCGYTATYLGCIYIFNDHLNPSKRCGGHTINHCDIYNSGRAVISVFGTESVLTGFDPIEISYNRIHDGCILSNDGGLFNSWNVTLGNDPKKTQIHHNLIWDQWGQFWAGLVYPDNNSYKMEAHHNILWYSATNKYDPKGRLFWKANAPNDCSYHDNTEKNNYSGGVAGLTNSDYPGGYFQTGTTFEVNVDTCLITSIKNILAENVFDVAVYPNPASHMVYISYQLPEYQSINVVLYDSMGIEVMNLTKEKQDMGEHLLSMNTEKLQNGIYFVIMNLKGSQIARKLIVNR